MTEELIYQEILDTPRAILDTIASSRAAAEVIAEQLHRRSIRRALPDWQRHFILFQPGSRLQRPLAEQSRSHPVLPHDGG